MGSGGHRWCGRRARHSSLGNSFGEISLIDGLPRSANVVALGPTVCYFLPRDALMLALRENLEIAFAVLPAVASMVRSSDQWVAQLI